MSLITLIYFGYSGYDIFVSFYLTGIDTKALLYPVRIGTLDVWLVNICERYGL